MPYTRRRHRLSASGRVTIRLTTAQRDVFIESSKLPASLGHLLHRAPVRDGKLNVRVTRGELDALITAAAICQPKDRREEKNLGTLLRYLERLEDRFEEPEESEDNRDRTIE
jgi:hypothetical protein